MLHILINNIDNMFSTVVYVTEGAEARRRAEERGVRRERNMRARTQVRLFFDFKFLEIFSIIINVIIMLLYLYHKNDC